MTTKHTPGPWKSEMGGRQIFAPGKKHIATAHYGGQVPVEVDESESNALLIAAAPELLAALEGILAAFEFYKEPEKIAAAEAARAAIAKATNS